MTLAKLGLSSIDRVAAKLLVVLLVPSALSCSMEAVVETEAASGFLVPYSFEAEISDSKSLLDGNSTVWEKGDEIAVFDGAAKQKFTLVAGAGTSSAVFSGVVTKGAKEFYAVSPYSAADSSHGDTLVISLPSVQVIPDGRISDPKAMVQIAHTTSDGLAFKNVTSRVRFTVTTSAVKSVFFLGNDSEKFAGSMALKYSAGDMTTLEASDGTLSIRPESGTFRPGTYYGFISPTSFSKGIAVSEDNTDNILLRSTGKKTEFARNSGKDIGDFDGAKKMPTTISSATDFKIFATLVKKYPPSVCISLGANLSIGGSSSLLPIDLSCNFDGKGYSLYGFTASGSGSVGLFGKVTGNISNLVIGSIDGKNYDGTSTISYNASSAPVTGDFCVGAIAELAGDASLVNVTNFVPVSVNANGTRVASVGGLVGKFASSGNIGNCVNGGAVSCMNSPSDPLFIGGVAGCSSSSLVKSCVNRGAISFHGRNFKSALSIAGVIGAIQADCAIEGCDNYGAVSVGEDAGVRNTFIGGVLGNVIRKITLKNCVNNADVSLLPATSGSNYIYPGGVLSSLANGSSGSTVEGCTNNGKVVNVTSSTAGNGSRIGGVCASSVGNNSFIGCTDRGGLVDESGSTNCHMGGVLGYCSGTVSISGCVCSSVAVVKSTGNHSSIALGGILGACGTNSVSTTVDSCRSAANIAYTGTAATVSAFQIVGGRYILGKDVKSITNCGIGGYVLGTSVSKSNYTSYVNGDGCVPSGTYFMEATSGLDIQDLSDSVDQNPW